MQPVYLVICRKYAVLIDAKFSTSNIRCYDTSRCAENVKKRKVCSENRSPRPWRTTSRKNGERAAFSTEIDKLNLGTGGGAKVKNLTLRSQNKIG